MPHDPDVLLALRRRLAEAGRLTFAEVMETALYHPVGGYYTAHVALGREGDFVTAPEEHPAFGALLARQAAQCWTALGHPADFILVEMGGGRGTLAADLLAYAHVHLPDFATALRYQLIDRSPCLLAQQHARLQPFGAQVDWADHLPDGFTGLLLSNELIDAFPVHRVVRRGGILRECYVVAEGDGFAWDEGPLSTFALEQYFALVEVELAEGQAAEVNLMALDWVRAVSASLVRGFICTIDFGHVARVLFQRGGTLLAYRGQRVSDDLLADLGRQDLIAHVDFSALVRAGRAAGLEALGLVTQADALRHLGLEGWLAALDDLSLPLAQRVANRRGLLALLDPADIGLGDAKVLVQARGVETALDCLTPAVRTRNTELLRREGLPLLPTL